MKNFTSALSLCLMALMSGLTGMVMAQPTDNPMATFYSATDGYPGWTDDIKWDRVVDMSTYSNGATNLEKFNNARDEVYALGGGVLYYPAGTYVFNISDGPNSEGLMLKKGVVIRGQAPTSDKIAVTHKGINPAVSAEWMASHGLNSLTTKFKFTRKMIGTLPDSIPGMWNMIGIKAGTNEQHLGQVSHTGVAWIEMEYGFIFFGAGASAWRNTYETDPANGYQFLKNFRSGWGARIPNGSHPIDFFAGIKSWGNDTVFHGEKMFVFGCNLKNSVVPNYVANKPNIDTWQTDPGGMKWMGKIGMSGAHLFVGNNVIDKPTKAFHFDYKDKAGNIRKVVYDYGYGIGIDINKSLIPGFRNCCVLDGSMPDGYYSTDVVVKDNWMYTHGNKGTELSGRWLVARNNVNFKEYLGLTDVYGLGSNATAVVDPSDGVGYTAENAADFQSRGFDIGGYNVWIHENRYTGTGSIGNDGEGILIQRHNGVEAFSFAYTYNQQGPTGENGYLAPYDVHVLGLFHGWNKQRGSIGILKTDNNWAEDISAPKEINVDLNNNPKNPSGVAGTRVQDFFQTCDSATATVIDSVLEVNIINDLANNRVEISWVDNTTNEIAFRVDRRPVGETQWNVIAYRPREHTNTSTSYRTLKTTANYGSQNKEGDVHCWPDIPISSFNQQKWVDYLANSKTSYEYRVVAVDCDDDAQAATSPIPVLTEISSLPIKALGVSIVPNPVNSVSVITFSLEGDESAKAELFNSSGVLVKTLANNNKSGQISLSKSGLPTGMYIVKIATDRGRAVIQKVIIE